MLAILVTEHLPCARHVPDAGDNMYICVRVHVLTRICMHACAHTHTHDAKVSKSEGTATVPVAAKATSGPF